MLFWRRNVFHLPGSRDDHERLYVRIRPILQSDILPALSRIEDLSHDGDAPDR
jgi:hypothetical protein